MTEQFDAIIDSGMQEALRLAEVAFSEDEVPVGAVVVCQGQIIGRGCNQRERRQSPVAHAEVVAIEEAARALKSWRLINCILVVTLEPCPMCLAASQQARISKLIYGAPDPKGGAVSLGYALHTDVRTNHRFPVELRHDPRCGDLLRDFFARKRKSGISEG